MSRPPFPVFLRCTKCAKPFRTHLRDSYSCLDPAGIAAEEAALKAAGGDWAVCPYCRARFNPWTAIALRLRGYGELWGEEAEKLAAMEAEVRAAESGWWELMDKAGRMAANPVAWHELERRAFGSRGPDPWPALLRLPAPLAGWLPAAPQAGPGVILFWEANEHPAAEFERRRLRLEWAIANGWARLETYEGAPILPRLTPAGEVERAKATPKPKRGRPAKHGEDALVEWLNGRHFPVEGTVRPTKRAVCDAVVQVADTAAPLAVRNGAWGAAAIERVTKGWALDRDQTITGWRCTFRRAAESPQK